MEWEQFLDDAQIEYVSRGPNTKRGEISIQCPWCGDDDPSFHLGINPVKGVYGCWRDVTHAGRDPAKLIKALIGCSDHQARLIVSQYSRADPDQFDGLLPPPSHINAPKTPVALPLDCANAIKPSGPTARFWAYLQGRGFDDIKRLCHDYGLTCSLTGRFKDRVIIPVFGNGSLVGWTGRAIVNPKQASRYLSSSETIKHTVYNLDVVEAGGKQLIVTEGPFDALKIDFYGRIHGVVATCTFGVNFSLVQASILAQASKGFERVRVMFDNNATVQAMLLAEWLPGASVEQVFLNRKDPGDLTKEEVDETCKG